MDVQPTNQQAISDDQELAKVLAGVSDETANDEQSLAIPEPVAPPTPMPSVPPVDDSTPSQPEDDQTPQDSPVEPQMPPSSDSPSTPLDDIKQQAIGELRPLVDKLNVSAEEKFDTYLLLLRSTDDRALIAPAHAAAQNITDEARKAQALLDIIKEIDYLSNPQQ